MKVQSHLHLHHYDYIGLGYQLCIYFADTIRHALSVGYLAKNAYALIKKNVRIINKTDQERLHTHCEQTARSRFKKKLPCPQRVSVQSKLQTQHIV